MEVRLRVLEGKSTGQEISVAGPKFFIGRSDDCQLRPRSDMVSRHHCVILVDDDYVAVRDFGSKNGTMVNGELIRSEHELNDGDRLSVGPLEFEVRVAAGADKILTSETQAIQASAEHTVSDADANIDDEDLDLEHWFGGSQRNYAADADTKTVDMSELVSSRDYRKRKPGEDEEDPDAPKVVGVSSARAKKVTAASSRIAAQEALKKMLRNSGR